MNSPRRTRHSALERWLAAAPTDEETARAAVAPYLGLDAAARWEALTQLLREVDAVLGSRLPVSGPDDVDFWRHWKDPLLGQPR